MAKRVKRAKVRSKALKKPAATAKRAGGLIGTRVPPQAQMKPSPAYRRFCEIALKLPGVEEVTSYSTPGLKVKGRLLCRLRTEAEGALALRCDFLDRQILLQADPTVFFVTDHYINYPMILVRLEKIRRSALPELVQRAWRLVAPPRLVAEFDAAST